MNPRQGECGDSEMSIIFSPLVLELIHIHVTIYLYIYHRECSFSLVMGKYILTTKSSKKSDSQHQTLINQNIEEHLIKGLACEQLLPL